MVGLNVVLNFWRREFYNALQDKDWNAFLDLLFIYRHDAKAAACPASASSRCVFIVVAVYCSLPEPVAADPLAPLADRRSSWPNGWPTAPITASA